MKKNYLAYLLTFFILLSLQDGKCQTAEIFRSCEVLTIDSSSLLPDYYIIKTNSEKGKIIILSKEDIMLNNKNTEKIIVHEKYDLELVKLDSITVRESDTLFNFNFNQIRGLEDCVALYLDGERFLEFENGIIKAYKALNLNGLFYNQIDRE
jgi:hypothetical protein